MASVMAPKGKVVHELKGSTKLPEYPNEMGLSGRALHDHQVLWDRAAVATAKALLREIERRHGWMMPNGGISVAVLEDDWVQIKRDLGLE